MIQISRQEARTLAEQYFKSACGFDISDEENRHMWQAADSVREKCFHDGKITAVFAFFGPEVFQRGRIEIEGKVLYGKAFERIKQENVWGVCLFMLTAGELQTDGGMVSALYADMWGTAYVDAGRVLLQQEIERGAKDRFPGASLSRAFGPGFYGMAVEKTAEIDMVLEGSKIGVSVEASGLMKPIKSCTGIYFVMSDALSLPEETCSACLGNPGGCGYCRVR